MKRFPFSLSKFCKQTLHKFNRKCSHLALAMMIFTSQSFPITLSILDNTKNFPATPPAITQLQNLSTASAGQKHNEIDPRHLPASLIKANELYKLRSARSAVYQIGEDQYSAIISTENLHYQGVNGEWKVSDPSFVRDEDSFVVTHNSIQSRAGSKEAWITVAVEETAFSWKSNTLNAVTNEGGAIQLAETLSEPEKYATLDSPNQVLTYSNGWDDPSLQEQFISAPDSLEHTLVLQKRPAIAYEKIQYLELQATLELFPGASIWTGNQRIHKDHQQVETLEIRQKDGTPVLVFEPVLAFEQEDPAQSIQGIYSIRPGSQADTWTISLQTPWSWWIDPQRSYPVVLDPTMKVLKSTGYADGMAWVRSTGLQDYSLGGIRLGAHLPDWNTETRGYVQFNSLPALISQHPSPIQVKKATLLVKPTLPPEAMPYYTNSPVDWEHKVFEKKTDLYYLGACPDINNPACANGFSLHDNDLLDHTIYNWNNSPQGTKIDTKPIKAGPASGSAEFFTTEFDVTNQIQDWYTSWYKTQINRPAPVFMLQFVKPSGYTTICPQAGPYTFGFNNKSQLITSYKEVPNCIWFDLPTGSIQLLVEYDELPLTIGDNLLNTPGVPSYLEDVFADTDHQYDLGIQAGSPVWRMVAARGNHQYIDDEPGVPARVGLELLDYSSGEPESPLATAAGEKPDQTIFIAIDDHHPSTISAANLKVEVNSSSDNDYASDIQRNYRIEYIEAYPTSLTPSTWTNIPINFPSDHLANMVEFHLNEGDNVLIKTDLPSALDFVLIEPGDGVEKQGAVIGADNNRVNKEGKPASATDRSLEIGSIPKSGKWSLAVINQERPFRDSMRPDYPAVYSGNLKILVCAKGSIPTVKFQSQGVNCQPLILPDSSPPPNRIMPVESGGSLTIHSEGGFIDNPSPGVNWCTTNEGAGAPIIESAASIMYGTYVFVGQGSVCRQGGQLITTPESGVGLTVPVYNFNPANKRGKYAPGFVYGSTAFYPLPSGMNDGQVQMAANGDLIPLPNTRRNIQPFYQYWDTLFTQTPGSERISISDLRAREAGTLYAQIMIEVDQPVYETSWNIDWMLYPNMDTAVPTKPAYSFLTHINQLNPLPTVIDLASLEVRLVDGVSPDGLLPILDSMLTSSGPNAYQFRATGARMTAPASLGGATTLGQAIIQPPGRPRLPKNQVSCKEGAETRSCFDLRRPSPSYDWQNGDGEVSVKPWELPDIHIEDQAGSVLISQEGQLSIFSADHPQAANAIGQTFSFDTWEATVVVDHAACTPGGPVTSVIRGKGHIALPSLGDNGGLAPPWIAMEFMLCETKFQEATLTLAIPEPGIPVGSTGVGVNLIGGTVTVGPDYTQIMLSVGFQTMDQYILTKGKGTVTINTQGMFSLQAQGKLVGIVSAKTLKLDVAWNPLDVLFAGELEYTSFLSGSFSMHGWIGQGWQNKYFWLPGNNSFHFTGTVKGTVKIPKGELINKKYFKLPPFTASISVKVAFGEFCTNSGCTSYKWGMSATVEVFGYDVGLYVDSNGPDLILGSSSHKLIDQFGGGSAPQTIAFAEVNNSNPIIYPGNLQQYLEPPISSSLDLISPDLAQNVCGGYATSVHICPFTMPTGTGKAMFSASWENGSLAVALIKPDGTEISASNAAANGVTITPSDGELTKGITFSVKASGNSTLATGEWKLRLSNVGLGLPAGFTNNYSLLFAADPPAPSILWNALPNPNGSGIVNLSWAANRGGQTLESNVKAELFYQPVSVIPKPNLQPVTFPGSYQAASGLGPDWSPSDTSTQASDDNQDGVWKFVTTAIPVGSWEFKVALGGSWLENYGLNGEPDGDNIPFQVNQTGEEVHFYYDPRDNTVLSRPDSRVINLVGDMMAEVGGANWAADNLFGLMKDPDGDQVYEISLQIPAGNWHFKVAVNESFAENYGMNGVPGGSNIPLTVPAGGGLVVFRYNDLTHLISAEVGAPVMEGTLIVSQLAANTNSYAWNTQGVASGEYRVGIRVDDHLKSNGHIVAWALGKVTLNDTTPPPAPNYVGSFAVNNGLVIRWDRDDVTPDLAGYLIEYEIPEWDLVSKFSRIQRVLPSSKEKAPFYQQARLGGLIYNISTLICIRAYDASGNISDCSIVDIEMPEGPVERIGPPRFFNGGSSLSGLSLTWEPPEFGTPDGYLLYYEPIGCLQPDVVTIADEGKSPIILPLGDLNFSLSSLTVGQRYRFTLHAYTDQGDISPGVSFELMFVDPTDLDGDGMADQWESLYGVSNPFDDTDLDGLNDLAEYQNGSNPLHADSDLDEYYDGEEAEWGSDICGAGQPPYHKNPKLVLVNTNTVNFATAVNYNPGNTEFIQILNFGGSNLIWNATPSQRWIMLSSFSGGENENLAISVDITGLLPGLYTGEILIFTLPAVQNPTEEATSIQESISIPVSLLVYPPILQEIYLPVISH